MQTEEKRFWSLMIFALVVQTIGVGLYFIVFDEGTTARVLYAVVKITMLALPIVFVGRIVKLRTLFAICSPKAAFSGLMAGIIMSAAVLAVYTGLFERGFLSKDFAEAIADKIFAYGITEYYLYFAIFLSLLHSLFEEYYWRWFVFGGLRTRLSLKSAALISSAGFSLHHFIVLYGFLPIAFVLPFGIAIGAAGYYWCVSYERYRSVIPAWISHALVDAAIMLVVYTVINWR